MKNSAIPRHACDCFTQTAPDAPSLTRSQEERDGLRQACLPLGWKVDNNRTRKPARGKAFKRIIGVHKLRIVNTDYGWFIQREEWGRAGYEVLFNVTACRSVLCDNFTAAAQLAEAAHSALPPSNSLTCDRYVVAPQLAEAAHPGFSPGDQLTWTSVRS
jgi:hypothetical protein